MLISISPVPVPFSNSLSPPKHTNTKRRAEFPAPSRLFPDPCSIDELSSGSAAVRERFRGRSVLTFGSLLRSSTRSQLLAPASHLFPPCSSDWCGVSDCWRSSGHNPGCSHGQTPPHYVRGRPLVDIIPLPVVLQPHLLASFGLCGTFKASDAHSFGVHGAVSNKKLQSLAGMKY